MTALERISGAGGCKLLTATAYTGQEINALVVNADASISVLEIDGVDVLTAMNLSGQTLSAGSFIVPPVNSKISKITVSSGSIWAYL